MFVRFDWRKIQTTVVPGLLVVGLFGCGRDKQTTSLEYVPHMMDSQAVKAQKLGPFGEVMRTPPVGTIARNRDPMDYYTTSELAKNPEEAGRQLKNPMPVTMAVLQRGKQQFETFCIVCHGPKGEGDGSIIPKFPRPPSLLSDKVRAFPDGRLFHIISAGQNLMPAYASQIAPKDRWAIAHYIRVLHRATQPKEGDLKMEGAR